MASSAPTAKELRAAMKEILKVSDLSALSSKKVRKQLELKFGQELCARKEELDAMLMELVSQLEGGDKGESSDGDDSDEEDPETSNGNQEDDTSLTKEPPRKKKKSGDGRASTSKSKKSAATVDDSDEDHSSSDGNVDDERLARQLQHEELGVRPRGRKAAAEKAKKPKEKKEKPEGSRKGNSLYSRQCVLSEELAAIMGQDRMARKDVVSGMWKIFKERQLQDPSNKQYVCCDEQLQKVFKVKKFKAFGMMKILKNHMKDEKLVTS